MGQGPVRVPQTPVVSPFFFLREWTFADRSGSYALCVIRPGSAMLAWSILSQGRLKEEWIGT